MVALLILNNSLQEIREHRFSSRERGAEKLVTKCIADTKFSTWTGLFLDKKLFAVDLMQVSTLLTLGRRARSLH